MLKKKYFFGIDDQEIGPLNEEAIKQKIKEEKITEETFVWCKGMKAWQKLCDVPELKEALGPVLDEYVKPPPLPKTPVIPPPLPKRAAAAEASSGGKEQFSGTPPPSTGTLPEGLTPLNETAYRFVMWGFRPWRGQSSFVQEYVRQDPRRAVSVAVVSILALVLMFAGTLAVISGSIEEGTLQVQQQAQTQAPPMQGGGDWQRRYQIWQDQQRDTQRILDDTYRYRRDSQDRMDETYKRATYDWYNDRND